MPRPARMVVKVVMASPSAVGVDHGAAAEWVDDAARAGADRGRGAHGSLSSVDVIGSLGSAVRVDEAAFAPADARLRVHLAARGSSIPAEWNQPLGSIWPPLPARIAHLTVTVSSRRRGAWNAAACQPFGSRWLPSPARIVVEVVIVVSHGSGGEKPRGDSAVRVHRAAVARADHRLARHPALPCCGWMKPRSGPRGSVGVELAAVSRADFGLARHRALRGERWRRAGAASCSQDDEPLGAGIRLLRDGRAGPGRCPRRRGRRCGWSWSASVRVDAGAVAGPDVRGRVHRDHLSSSGTAVRIEAVAFARADACGGAHRSLLPRPKAVRAGRPGRCRCLRRRVRGSSCSSLPPRV